MRSGPRSRRAGRTGVALLAATAASLVFAVPGANAAPKGGAPAPVAPVMPCEDLRSLALPNTTVTEAVLHPADDTTPASCRVTLVVTDPEDDRDITVWVNLPESTWNGRFQGVGGGGFSAGGVTNPVAALRQGYAAASTDAGVAGDGSWALQEKGVPDLGAIEDFGHEAIHDMTVVGKAVTTAYYGQAPAYSYFNGCSTGGRQGLMEAQRYPDDYDGIVAGAPVINWAEMQTMQIWGQVVMNEEDNPIAPCKFAAAVQATIEACDTVGDRVVDGVIGDPLGCDFDLGTLEGTPTPCGTITAKDVEVMRSIAAGPRSPEGEFLWYGLAPGAPHWGLHAVDPVTLEQLPFAYDIVWFKYWLARDADFDWSTLTYESFAEWFDVAVDRYSEVAGASNPDLSAFRKSGGKLVMWHGAADFGVPFQGTVDYYERVQDELGPGRTQQFARLFLAPGVGHCGGGAPVPVDPLAAVVEWVENGKAPRTLDAALGDTTRPLCQYPAVARWTGRGDAADGRTYTCVRATELEPRRP